VSQKPSDAGKLRRYLLGALSEDETAELEGLYFASDELFEELLAEEDDLVDAYVSGELTPDEMSRFDALLSGSARLRGDRNNSGQAGQADQAGHASGRSSSPFLARSIGCATARRTKHTNLR